MKSNSVPFVVNYVSFQQTQLVDHNNKYHNNIGIAIAKQMAKDAGMELVCFSMPEQNTLALCKIIDYGKWKYSNEKKMKKQNKERKKVTKEIWFSPNIGDHDVEHKIRQAIKFLEDDDDVIFSMRLKGREKIHFKEAEERLNEIIKLCDGHGKEVARKKSSDMIIVRLTKITK